jgi:hypothetical protein
LVLLVLIVSKSSFILLLFLSVAFLASAASLQSGGVWWGEIRGGLQYEVHADLDALKYDAYQLQVHAESAPHHFRSIWHNAGNDFRILKADVSIDARIAAKHFSILIKTT